MDTLGRVLQMRSDACFRKPIRQQQCIFHLKFALPFVKMLLTASDCGIIQTSGYMDFKRTAMSGGGGACLI